MTHLCRSALILALLVPLCACSYVKTPVLAFNDDGEYLPGTVGQGLVAAPTSLIPDVPTPVGFKVVNELSGHTWNGQVREVYHVYQGRSKDGDAAAFYQRTLPSNGWNLQDIKVNGNTTTLNYSKGGERLLITIEEGWSVTTVNIDIDAR